MERLRELREEKHLNQQKLAMELNITQAAISKYEIGTSEPDINMLKNIASFFNVSVDYLIGFSESRISCNKSDLSQDELTLLSNYRNLKGLQKEKLLSYLNGLLQI